MEVHNISNASTETYVYAYKHYLWNIVNILEWASSSIIEGNYSIYISIWK